MRLEPWLQGIPGVGRLRALRPGADAHVGVLVDAAGRSERNRTSFEVFMRRLGRPDYGVAILREMRGDAGGPGDDELPFERLVFGGAGSDVLLPPAASEHEFRVYRAGDLILVRNTGDAPLWIRGRCKGWRWSSRTVSTTRRNWLPATFC